MSLPARVASSVLLVAGLALVFAGLSAALGATLAGIVASVTLIAGLLYAGATWFSDSRAHADAVIVAPDFSIGAGPYAGRALQSLFPRAMQAELEARCREAFSGRSVRFTSTADPAHRVFDVAPLRTDDGQIPFVIVLSGALVRRRPPAAV